LGVVAVEAAKRSGSLITHGLRSSKGARSFPCRAPRSTRAPNGPTACSDRERPPSPRPPTLSASWKPILGAQPRPYLNRRNPPAPAIAPTTRKPQRASWRCSGRRPLRSTTSFNYPVLAPRLSARFCLNSKSPGGGSGSAVGASPWPVENGLTSAVFDNHRLISGYTYKLHVQSVHRLDCDWGLNEISFGSNIL